MLTAPSAQRSCTNQTFHSGKEGIMGAGPPRGRLCPCLKDSPAFPGQLQLVPSSGPAPTFFGSASTFYLLILSSNMTMDFTSLNWKLLTRLQANSPSPLPSTCPKHLPSGLPTSTPPSSKLALYFLCQTPPKSFTNSSEFLASCAFPFIWIVACDIWKKKQTITGSFNMTSIQRDSLLSF